MFRSFVIFELDFYYLFQTEKLNNFSISQEISYSEVDTVIGFQMVYYVIFTRIKPCKG